MPEQTIPSARTPKLPGLDSKITPMLGVGLGLKPLGCLEGPGVVASALNLDSKGLEQPDFMNDITNLRDIS